MLLFHWINHEEMPFQERYRRTGLSPEGVVGQETFEALVRELQGEQLELKTIKRAFDGIVPPQPACPRLFVSHRQVDVRIAERNRLASMLARLGLLVGRA